MDSKIAAEIVVELLLLTTPERINITGDDGIELKFIGLRYSD